MLFPASEAKPTPQSLFGCLDAGWRDGSGFWVHPTAADAALHGAAFLQKEARTVSAVDYYAPGPQLQGELPPLRHRVNSLPCQTASKQIAMLLVKKTQICCQ